jgi:hypothetical protein
MRERIFFPQYLVNKNVCLFRVLIEKGDALNADVIIARNSVLQDIDKNLLLFWCRV